MDSANDECLRGEVGNRDRAVVGLSFGVYIGFQ